MGLFPTTGRQMPRTQAHAGEHCPWCEQPITHDKFEDIRRRMAAEQDARMAALAAQHEQEKSAVERRSKAAIEAVRAETAAAAEAKLQAMKAESMRAVEAQVAARLGEVQARLAEAEAAKVAAQQQMAELKEMQAAAVDARVAEIEAGLLRQKDELQREKDAAILAERTKAFEDQQKLQSKLQDLQRQLEKKSAHELGEGSEIDLFEQLRAAFESDRITRVGKGVNGADVIHEVIHNGKVCGRIVYDAKNRNAWQNEFVTKLRADKIAQAADHAILSSNKFPKDTAHVHYQDGVIIAAPQRVVAIVQLLRDQVVRMHELRISKEGREQKSVELYAFITSEHCKALLDQVETQAARMLELDGKEQEAHRRLWDQRKKLINSVQKARSDLVFEIDRIIGTAGNGPEEDAA
jgi:hypothetical protein